MNEETNKKIKYPFPVRSRDALEEIVKSINSISSKYELPFCELENIVYRIYVEVKSGADQEYIAAKENYNKAIQAKESEVKEDGGINNQENA